MNQYYNIEPIDLSDEGLHKASELLNLVFKTDDFSVDFLRWQYVENPDGPAVGFNAWHNDELVAHYATQPWPAELGGNIVKGLLSLNTATHPDHQGKKLFTNAAEKTYAAAKEQGYCFVIGVANKNSTPGFINKLNFQLVGPLKAEIGLDYAHYDGTNCCEFTRQWTKEQLAWRMRNPQRGYLYKRKEGYTHIYADPGRTGVKALLAIFPEDDISLVRMFHQPPGKWLTLYIGMDPNIRQRGWFNLPIPKLLRPSPLNLIFRDIDGCLGQLDKETVRFRALDFDAY